ncbi:endopolyphosphatase [Plectosphaerella cucumerina]|uniref:Endopolyphosphatase n=1 Tax=Plectosphaerella cucumerina TaxID=40658 RepID=A0A8K0TPL5_9PEZI|nr:endopolyphosphatase [Plectosphaerella cucumerina]
MAASLRRLTLALLAVVPVERAATYGSPLANGEQQVISPDLDLSTPPTPPHTHAASPGKQGHQRKLRGRFLHITDLHPDDFYKAHTSTAEGIACHRGSGPAGYYGAETSDCDSPFSLLDATLDWIADNIASEIDFVVWTGDTARHDSDEKKPRSQDQVLGSNRRIADKFFETFSNPKDKKRLGVPVVPNLGNNDILPHNILVPGPTKWLQYYTDVWRHFIPEEQRHSFEFGGWFDVEVIPNKLTVFSLNTLYLFDRNAAVDGCNAPSEPGFKQMEWLRIQLQILRERNMKAILIGHVPPARTDSKQNWDESCWQKYNLWMRQYRDVVVASLYGHMNIDHFIAHDTQDIQLGLINGGQQRFSAREAMEDEFSVQSATDYLQELRQGWSKIPKVGGAKALDEEGDYFDDLDDDLNGLDDEESMDASGKKKKKHKGKKGNKIGKYAERYHISLISPSVVPNYFPTIRVYEYNISGLENTPAWSDTNTVRKSDSAMETDEDSRFDELRRREDSDDVGTDAKKGGKKGKKGKKKPHDPNLIVPEPPSKSSPPGPAYSAQPLTLTGYTQYFANLTYLNNDMTEDGPSSFRWRDGIHKDKDPKSKKPHPRPFAYEVEYSTFTDKIFKLKDLTVRSYVKLAYRIGQTGLGKSSFDLEDFEKDFEEDDDEDEAPAHDEASDSSHDWDNDDVAGVQDDEDDEFEVEGKKGKHRGKGKKRKQNKVWLHFLDHAFVSTVPKKRLKKL